MIESGVLHHRYTFWFGEKQDTNEACRSDAVLPVGLHETYTAFLLLAISVGIAMAIFALELVKHKIKN